MLLFSWGASAHADEQVWAMQVGDEVFVPLNTVAYTMLTDYDDSLLVVTKDGTVYRCPAQITFRQQDLTAIENATAPTAESQIVMKTRDIVSISGVAEGAPIEIYALDGGQRLSAKAVEGENIISVAHLPAGVYVIKANKVAVKFIKQ